MPMNKNFKNIIIDLIYLILGIGLLVLVISIVNTSNFVPNISLCASYPNVLCETPIIRNILNIFSLKFWVSITSYLIIGMTTFSILEFIGLKSTGGVGGGNAKKWTRYGWIAALILSPIFLLLLILYAD